MRRILMKVAYDGTNYCGFQIQPNAITIEGVLNETLTACLKEEIRIIGASRTDSGVHAMANVAVFDTESRIEAGKVAIMMNQHLPEDIRIRESYEVPADFHPRHVDCVKTYNYKIYNAMSYDPLARLDTTFYHGHLDEKLMQEGADYLIGEHDFTSFSSIHKSAQTAIRTIYSINVVREGEIINIIIKGNGFLYNMVRIIAGTLIEVGNGKISPKQVLTILQGMDRNLAGQTAPAKGLTLVEIKYLKGNDL